MAVVKAMTLFFIAVFTLKAMASGDCAAFLHSTGPQTVIKELAELRLNIDAARAQGKSAMEVQALEGSYSEKEREVLQITGPGVTREELRASIKPLISELQQNEAKEPAQVEQQREAIYSSMGQRVHFHWISPGKFRMGSHSNKVEVELTDRFAMMTMPVTQYVWRAIAERLVGFGPVEPSHNLGVDHPVENANPDTVQRWIAGLNDLIEKNDPVAHQIFPNHQPGEVYRLPTEAEWEFVARGQGAFEDERYFIPEGEDINDYGWFNTATTHPVGQKKPLIVEGGKFYDILGNVLTLTADGWLDRIPGGINPLGFGHPDQHVYRGSSHRINPDEASTLGARANLYRFTKSPVVGFRLVKDDGKLLQRATHIRLATVIEPVGSRLKKFFSSFWP